MMTSDLISEAKESGTFEITVEATESGWADLTRLQLLAVFRSDDPQSYAIDVLPITTVESVRLHNTRELIRGQGYGVRAPAGVFSPYRQYGPIQLGQWWLEGGNTVSIRLRVDSVWGKTEDEGHFAFSASFPFSPDNRREFIVPADLAKRPRAYVASPPVAETCRYEDYESLQVQFDQDGTVDLSTLQIRLDSGCAPKDGSRLSGVVVESIELPTRQELVIGGYATGSRQRALTAAVFATLGRRFSWVDFGLLDVSTNNTLTLKLRSLTTPGSETDRKEKGIEAAPSYLSAGLQFYPASERSQYLGGSRRP